MSTAFHTPGELQGALLKLVPAMGSGFTITTQSGETLTLLPGRLVDRISDELTHGLRLELMRREARQLMGLSA